MPKLGFQELLLILLIFLLLFGATKLPELARSIGKSMREFKKGMSPEDEAPSKGANTKEEARK